MLKKLLIIGAGLVFAAAIWGGGVSAFDNDAFKACLNEKNGDEWRYTVEECYEKQDFSFDNPRVGEQHDVNLHDGSSANDVGDVTLTSTDVAQANCNATGNGCDAFTIPDWMADDAAAFEKAYPTYP